MSGSGPPLIPTKKMSMGKEREKDIRIQPEGVDSGLFSVGKDWPVKLGLGFHDKQPFKNLV